MTTYRVVVQEEIHETRIVTIDAATPEEAARKAYETIIIGDFAVPSEDKHIDVLVRDYTVMTPEASLRLGSRDAYSVLGVFGTDIEDG